MKSQNTLEEWRPIDGFDDRYAVSNRGRVMNLKTERVLKNTINTHGYYVVNLGKGNTRTVHKLVATAFIENPNNLPQVNHISEDKRDNNVNNLEWVSASKNIRHSVHQQSCRINQLTLDGKFIRQWDSSHEIERELGYECTHIIAVCKGKRKTANGFCWQYADPSRQRKCNRPVAALTKDGDLIADYKSAAEAARCLKICSQLIRLCLKGTCKSTHGLRFIYID